VFGDKERRKLERLGRGVKVELDAGREGL